MKKTILLLFLFVGFICISYSSQGATEWSRGKLYIDEYDRGQYQRSLIAIVSVSNDSGKISGYWRHIAIFPIHATKRMGLGIQEFSTEHKTLTNIKIMGNEILFDMYSDLHDQLYHVVLTRDGKTIKDVHAVSSYTDEGKEYIIEWKANKTNSSNSPYIEIPYKRIGW